MSAQNIVKISVEYSKIPQILIFNRGIVLMDIINFLKNLFEYFQNIIRLIIHIFFNTARKKSIAPMKIFNNVIHKN